MNEMYRNLTDKLREYSAARKGEIACLTAQAANAIESFIDGGKQSSRNDELILIAAERYAMGRRTYIVSTVASYIRVRVPKLSDWCLGVLAQDYRDKLKEAGRLHNYGVFGAECDKKDWDALYEAINEEQGRRTNETLHELCQQADERRGDESDAISKPRGKGLDELIEDRRMGTGDKGKLDS